ncbi:MAG: [protein-PII] uridylyltransferase, partial [Acidimicrobiaceae bacterium]|nr:[protein-PII] uridylyltransferase [Acidimicrobiaceae bacterium]
GGLRDVHSLHWADAAKPALSEGDADELALAYEVLLDGRVALQRATGKSANALGLAIQPVVAAALGDADRHELMTRVAAAARTIAWISDDTWRRVGAADVGKPRLRRLTARQAPQPLAPGVVRRGDEAALSDDAHVASDPLVILRVAEAAAANGLAIERQTLERLARQAVTPPPVPWPDEARALFVSLLSAGAAAIGVIESLDQRGAWPRVFPEWDSVRSLPQFDAYHRYTVDRHLLETAAHAAALASRVERADLLVVAALLHDIGIGHGNGAGIGAGKDKGRAGDHLGASVTMTRSAAARMGFGAGDVDTLACLVEHHLLLADVATRRDLDDPATIERVAGALGTIERLHLLAALTEADSLATGPSAWGQWKAKAVAQLVERVAALLDGGGAVGPGDNGFPTPSQLARLAVGDQVVIAHDDVVTVMTNDRPGLFSRVAGVLALNGLDVLAAAAYSSEDGRALNEFRVMDPFRTETPWSKVQADIEQALSGRLAVQARVAERARTYRGRHAGPQAEASVAFDNEVSADATVIDVHAHDAVGVLYAITRALADLDLDIRSAKVQTLGSQVVDAFYVRDADGKKLTDPMALVEVERAILHSLASLA